MDGESSETLRGESSKDLKTYSTPIEETKQYQEFSVTVIDALDIIIDKYQDDLKKLSEKIQIEQKKQLIETRSGEGKISVLVLMLPEEEILKDWKVIKGGKMMKDHAMSSEDEGQTKADSS